MSEQDDATRPRLQQYRHALLGHSFHLGLLPETETPISSGRRTLQRFLTSKTGHYCVLILVSLDVSCIFTDFILTILKCESNHSERIWADVLDALGVVSLVFSSLFMVELIASLWAFGLRYFSSKFHILDFLVIVASFIVDILLRGTIKEVASLIILIRLWRVFKIIEELSMGAKEQMEDLQEKIRMLEHENNDLRQQIRDVEQGRAM